MAQNENKIINLKKILDRIAQIEAGKLEKQAELQKLANRYAHTCFQLIQADQLTKLTNDGKVIRLGHIPGETIYQSFELIVHSKPDPPNVLRIVTIENQGPDQQTRINLEFHISPDSSTFPTTLTIKPESSTTKQETQFNFEPDEVNPNVYWSRLTTQVGGFRTLNEILIRHQDMTKQLIPDNDKKTQRP